jgi:hypothetical protein
METQDVRTNILVEGRRMITSKSSSCMFFLLVAACLLTLAFSTTPLWAQAVAQQQVDLSSVFNVAGIYTDGTSPINGGLDGGGAAYSSIAMAATAPPNSGSITGAAPSYPTLSLPQTPNTIVFNFGPTNALDAVSGCTPVGPNCTVSTAAGPITLPSGEFTVLELVGTGVQGGQTGNVTVGYTDGTSDTFSQGFSDWFSGGPYNIGESIALLMPYRLSGGAPDNRNFRVYNYTIAINATKTVQSLTLPNNRDIVILAATLVAIPGFATSTGAPSATSVTPGSSVTVPVTVASEAGYSGTVTLNCTVSPAIATSGATAPGCSFMPPQVTVGVGAPGSATLTFSPAAPAKTASGTKTPSNLFYAFWLPITGLALVGFGRDSGSARRKKLVGLLILGMLLAGVIATPACVSYTHLGNVGTPPGNYTIAITGVDANGLTQLGAGGIVTVAVQ